MKKFIIVLFFSFIIPQGISWRTWLSMWPDLEKIVACESQFNPQAIGDHNKSFGIFQIHLPAHPTVSKAQAKNPFWSLAWAIDKYEKGEIGIWSCYKLLVRKGEIILD